MTSIALELPTGCQLIGSHVTRTYVPRVAYTHCTAVRSTQYWYASSTNVHTHTWGRGSGSRICELRISFL